MADIALFPLPLVLFPGCKLVLQIFEPRYLDMVKDCLRDNVGFGVILIRKGSQVLKAAEQEQPNVARCGTYSTIVDFDQQSNGLLQITVEGQVKFTLRERYETTDRLMMAGVEFLPLEDKCEVPANMQHLVTLLQSLTRHESVQARGITVDFEDAREVGSHLTELLPGPDGFKQRMLELTNPILRLSELEKQLLRMQGR